MAEQIASYQVQRVLDIGSGSGHGLIALTQQFGTELRIVGVDENLSCLKEAKTTLAAAGLTSELVARLSTTRTNWGFVQRGQAIDVPLPEPIALIEADPLTDSHLEAALADGGPFDAITVWLTGAHSQRRNNSYSIERGAKSEHDLRIILQNEAYELADRVLRPGGILQVVDRAEAPTTERLRDFYIKNHSEQAEPTTMQVRDVTYRFWEPPEGGLTPMVLADPDERPDDLPDPKFALVSIISVKT